MPQHSFLSRAARSVDTMLSRIVLSAGEEQGVLLSFLFHGLFENKREADAGHLDPQQGITVDMFSSFLSYFTNQNYQFVSVEDVLHGLKPGGRYLLLTFDDGYYNNSLALPLLEQFSVPAVFFISTGHVQDGKCYWWDVLYRQQRKRGISLSRIRRTQDQCKTMKTSTIESELHAEFGRNALKPLGDVDRPFNVAEIRRLAEHPLLTFGNHTQDHAILTNYSKEEVRDQIRGAQCDLLEWTGRNSIFIAYPNGNCSPEITQVAKDAGLQLGATIVHGRNASSLNPGSNESMHIKRFFLWSDSSVVAQCAASRSRVSVYGGLNRVRHRAKTAIQNLRNKH